jgi:hypothetical protein
MSILGFLSSLRMSTLLGFIEATCERIATSVIANLLRPLFVTNASAAAMCSLTLSAMEYPLLCYRSILQHIPSHY